MSGAKETRTAYRLNANKSKLYALAKKYYPEIEPMRKNGVYQISESPRLRSKL